MALILFALLCCVVISAPVKHLAGPVEEFRLHRIPDPRTVLVSERSASLNLWFKCSHCNSDRVDDSTLLSTTRFPVDGKDQFVLTFASPIASSVRVELLGPDGKPVDPKHVDVREGKFEINDNKDSDIPTTSYIVTDSVQGWYTFNVYSHGLVLQDFLDVQSNPHPDAVLSFINDDDKIIHSHLRSYVLRVGDQIGLVSSVGEQTDLVRKDINVMHAVMEVIAPDGSVVDVQMRDDGVSGDLLANDGVYGATVVATQPGVYILQANMDGFLGNTETPFQRTTEHAIKVSGSPIRLSGKATVSPAKDGKFDILIGLANTKAATNSIRAYAEVWGTSSAGLKPACWIGGVIESTASGTAKLVLDEKWLKRAGVQGPLVLKNVYISDLSTSFPLDAAQEDISVTYSKNIKFQLNNLTTIGITKEMRFGKNPLPKLTKVNGAADLVLLPGYCADVNPFSKNAHHFSTPFFPVDFGNYANDEYAKKIIKQVEDRKLSSFGLIGHSQGGMISLHIHNFYWTGLAEATGHRLIQTVGTPFQGSTAAGSAANLGNVFGIGCGASTDLSRDGAVNWLSGISTESRQDVHFYTTTYKQGTFFGDYCSLPMNLILQWPNDGLVELEYAQLPGGVSMGNKEKWCHSVDMGYPPQCEDEQRNAEMNANAAR